MIEDSAPLVLSFGRWELMTTDAAAASRFYHQLFGWEAATTELSGGAPYTHLRTPAGEVLGGLYAMAAGLAVRPVSPHWTPFLVVTAIDLALARAKALQAYVTTESFTLGEVGRMALLQDPTGAPVGLWQGSVPTAAALAWQELSTSDAASAARFYHGLCGWQISQDKEDSLNYSMFIRGSHLQAAMLALGPRFQTVPSHWLPYVRVADVAAAQAAVVAGGGRILAPASKGSLGIQAVAQDPQGAVFGLMASAGMQ